MTTRIKKHPHSRLLFRILLHAIVVIYPLFEGQLVIYFKTDFITIDFVGPEKVTFYLKSDRTHKLI